jgi:hypothetical protein
VPVEEHVADGAAAHRRDEREDEHTEQVELLAAGGEGARDGEYGRAEEIEDGLEHGRR